MDTWNTSRKAAKRVKNPIPAPTECPYCKGEVKIVNNAEIYGRSYGKWPWAYLCAACRAYVGMHPFTAIPLGTLANEALRKARNAGKRPFNELWRSGKMTRGEAYAALAKHMGLEIERCHFGWFDVEQCEIARLWAINNRETAKVEKVNA